MPELVTRIGPVTVATFTLLLALGAVVALTLALWRERAVAPAGAVADVCLGALIGAAVGGRLGHVALNWSYFGLHPDELFRLNAGGIDWHGAVVGGLAGLAATARWRGIDVRPLRDALTPALPLLAMASWYGCWSAACGYGAEVDTLAHFSPLAAGEAPDVYGIVAPRFNTQAFGIGLGAATLAVALAMMAIRPLRATRFWLVLALLSAGMFALGFLRGDFSPVVARLRLDQWLDLGMIGLCVVAIAGKVVAGISRPPEAESHPASDKKPAEAG